MPDLGVRGEGAKSRVKYSVVIVLCIHSCGIPLDLSYFYTWSSLITRAVAKIQQLLQLIHPNLSISFMKSMKYKIGKTTVKGQVALVLQCWQKKASYRTDGSYNAQQVVSDLNT